jgi:purine-binding chemotaxis protein CheW
MNLRGQIISIVDLRMKFKMAAADRGAETAVIILDISSLCLGVVVNSVNSVLAVEEENISPQPDIESNRSSDYLTGVVRQDKRLVLLLDIAKALSVEDLAALKPHHKDARQSA